MIDYDKNQDKNEKLYRKAPVIESYFSKITD